MTSIILQLLLLLNHRTQSFADLRTDTHGKHHLDEVSRDKWDNADCKGSRYRVVGLEAEPYGSECIADQGADDHADQLKPALFAVVNHKSGNDCHRDKAYYVTAGWSGELGNATGKTGKDRKSGKAEQ